MSTSNTATVVPINATDEDLAQVTEDDLEIIKRYLDFVNYGNSRLPIRLPISQTSHAYFNKWTASIAPRG